MLMRYVRHQALGIYCNKKVITLLGGFVVTFLMLFMHFLACQIFERAFPHNPSQLKALFWSAVNHIPTWVDVIV